MNSFPKPLLFSETITQNQPFHTIYIMVQHILTEFKLWKWNGMKRFYSKRKMIWLLDTNNVWKFCSEKVEEFNK